MKIHDLPDVERSNRRLYIRGSYLERKQQVLNMLGGACEGCGITDVEYLQFDHINNDRVHAITNLLNSSLPVLLQELSKCQVLCDDCHARKTYDGVKFRSKSRIHHPFQCCAPRRETAASVNGPLTSVNGRPHRLGCPRIVGPQEGCQRVSAGHRLSRKFN